MKKFCTILFLFTLHFGQAQFDPSKVNKKAAQLYSKALELAQGDHFREAIQVLQQAVKIEPGFEDAYLSIAGMYGELKNYQGAIDNYEKARSIDSEYFKDYNITYSINLAVGNAADPYSANVATVKTATASGNTVTVTFKGTPGYTEFTDYLWKAPVLPQHIWSKIPTAFPIFRPLSRNR